MTIEEFISACRYGDDNKVRSMVERDPALPNKPDSDGNTGLTVALRYKHHSISRWLLSLPGLDTNVRVPLLSCCDILDWTYVGKECMDLACFFDAPLDIVITLAKLSNWETANRNDNSALDLALMRNNTSIIFYLDWLGRECRKENMNCTEYNDCTEDNVVKLEDWIEAGCQQDAQYWAVAANDLKSLKTLENAKNVTLDRPKLKRLAKLFDHWAVWSYLNSLQSLAWEELQKSSPALLALPPSLQLERAVPGHVVLVIESCKSEFWTGVGEQSLKKLDDFEIDDDHHHQEAEISEGTEETELDQYADTREDDQDYDEGDGEGSPVVFASSRQKNERGFKFGKLKKRCKQLVFGLFANVANILF